MSSLFGHNILILVPHPDDEVVGCAAAIGRALEQGAKIHALYLTHGCIARETRWPWDRKNHEKRVATRTAEAKAAARFLNLSPLQETQRPSRHLWQDLLAVHQEIAAALAQTDADQLWVPAYEGGHADHDALNGLAALFAKKISVLEFAEYNFFNAEPQAQKFPYPNGTEEILNLTAAEGEKKRAALEIYKSERNNLNYVGITQEMFRPLASYDYSRPPHEGPLWYTRFQWVPFRHPRIDFTQPQDVCAALISFFKTPY